MDLPVHIGVFASAATSATLLPGTSEVLMLGPLARGFELWPLWLAATSGNVLGSTFNWWLGRLALRSRDRRWFPVGSAALERASSLSSSVSR